MENWSNYAITDYQRLKCIGKDEQEMLVLLLDNVRAGIGLFEVREQIRALYLNQDFFRITGYDREAYTQYEEDVIQALTPEDEKKFRQAVKEGRTTKNSLGFQVCGYRQDGTVGWYSIQAKPIKSRISEAPIYLAVITDITHTKEKEIELQKMNSELKIQQERYRILEATAQGILFEYFPEEDKMVLSYNLPDNQKRRVITEYLTFLEKSPMVHSDHIGQFKRELLLSCKESREGSMEYLTTLSGEGYRWHLVHYKSVENHLGKIASVMGRIEDIHDRKVERERVKNQAELDGLTNVYRKKVAMEKMRQLLKEDTIATFYFGILDLDNFKEINDRFGHQYGDRVIKEMADTLTATFGGNSIIGRFGGDEFIFLTQNITGEDILGRLENMKKTMQFSAGIVHYKHGEHLEEMFKRADNAMYQAKSNGRNEIIIEE